MSASFLPILDKPLFPSSARNVFTFIFFNNSRESLEGRTEAVFLSMRLSSVASVSAELVDVVEPMLLVRFNCPNPAGPARYLCAFSKDSIR